MHYLQTRYMQCKWEEVSEGKHWKDDMWVVGGGWTRKAFQLKVEFELSLERSQESQDLEAREGEQSTHGSGRLGRGQICGGLQKPQVVDFLFDP